MQVDLPRNLAPALIPGETVAGAVRVGLVQDFAESLLSGVLAGFARSHPHLRLDVQVAGSARLRRSLADGRLDVALCMALPREEPILSVPMRWHGHPGLVQRDPLPLVMMDAPCAFRDAALMALERAGLRWRVAVSTPSLSSLHAAVSAGLGLAVCGAQVGEPDRAPPDGLPPLGRVGYVVLAAADAGTAAGHLAGLLAEAMRETTPSD